MVLKYNLFRMKLFEKQNFIKTLQYQITIFKKYFYNNYNE